MTLTLNAQARDTKANISDMIPAVYYGAGSDATSISLDRKEFIKIYNEAGGSTLLTLEAPEGAQQVLIHDVQVDPVSHQVTHVDFLIIDTSKPIQVSIPLEFISEAPVEKQGLGVLNKSVQEIEIEVLPNELPSSLEIDLSSIATLDDSILAKDIVLPPSATLMVEEDLTIASASAMKEEVEEEGGNEIDFDAISASAEKGDAAEAEESSE